MVTSGHRRWDGFADAAVHVLSVGFGVSACIVLAVFGLPGADGVRVASLVVYGLGLLAMFGCSALFNLLRGHAWTNVFQRLDHAAIFLMIAATYTPFTLLLLRREHGFFLFVFVWILAAMGALLQLLAPKRLRRVEVAAYLLLGWSGAVMIYPLLLTLSQAGFILLCVGGLLYSVGVVFYAWKGLPCHTAIWHGFVLAAAACHFSAVITDVVAVVPPPVSVGVYEPSADLIRVRAS